MKIYRKLEQEQILSAVEIGLDILDTKPDVLDVITANGYRREDLDFIKQLCLDAKTKYEAKESKTRTKQGMTKRIEQLLEDLRKEFGFVFDAFQERYRDDPETWATLGLRTRRYVRRNAFLMKARCFFNEAGTDEYLDGLRGYGVSKERLKRGLALIDRIEEAVFQRHETDADKRYDRASRDRLISRVNKLWRTLEKSCRHWFRDTPWELKGIFDTAALPSRAKNKKPAEATTVIEEPAVPKRPAVPNRPAVPAGEPPVESGEPPVETVEPTTVVEEPAVEQIEERPVAFKGFPRLQRIFRRKKLKRQAAAPALLE